MDSVEAIGKAGEAAGADVAAALEVLITAAFNGDVEAVEEARVELVSLFQEAVEKAAEYGVAFGTNSAVEVFGGGTFGTEMH